MAGGIFTDRPFEPNIKCIVFAAIMILFYWIVVPATHRNYYIIPLIFIFAYVGMAWYDYMYNCDVKLYSGTSGLAAAIDAPFKPQRRNEPGEMAAKLDPEREKNVLRGAGAQEKAYLSKVYLFHSIAVAPLLIYVGLKGKESNEGLFGAVLGLGALAGMYHGFRLFVPRDTSC